MVWEEPLTQGDRVTLVDKALVGLRGLILSGEFDAGTRLPEVALAERIGVSRTPLRQAMDRLVAEGLLERNASGGCRVVAFDFDDVHDAIELRGVIEGTAARIAAERGADFNLLAEAREVLRSLDAVISDADDIDLDHYVSFNARFHALIAEMAGSEVVRREVDRISRLPLASPSAFIRGQEAIPDFLRSLTRAQGQHHAVIDAIENREGARAEALMREHARLARSNFYFLKNAEPKLATQIPGLSLVMARQH
jgi:GntR family transcriptional regulator of vanillate catabolism